MKLLLALVLTCFCAVVNSGLIKERQKRGYLSRTGLCPNPEQNYYIRDNRLNYFGNPIVLPGDEKPGCEESECDEDSHCDADRKCCKNSCGGMICTPSERDPNPCEKFNCPTGQTCHVHKVKCVMPECSDAIAINRPTCVPDKNAAAAPPKATEATAAQAYAAPMSAYTNPNQPLQDNLSPLLPPEQQPFVSPESASQFASPEPEQYAQPQSFDSQEPQMPAVDPQAFPPVDAYQGGPADTTSPAISPGDAGYQSFSR